ncbi:MAG: hypothetical protein A3B68_03555 [Candidatus Melainabacteria bacterium RIFCSPHIGHO2_02_FULL_34_12]|nr:MAG: hypothetical protein A3B68_03555 [Candidatus Melainabacteria bacterium RIFCSPHIGHO2_02_FULL_34_12]
MSFYFPALAIEEKDDYDSLIVRPSKHIANPRRINRLMYKRGFIGFQKVKDDLYVVPLNESDKKTKIAELKNSGLFELVEPDYKFTLDEIPRSRNYVKIIKSNESNDLNDNTNLTDISNLTDITPNDKDFSSQYYLKEINATKAWNVTVGDSSLVVGILDTGVDAKHPDLEGKVLQGINLSSQNYSDQIGHGTEVAGIIAAKTNNNQGIAGIGWNTNVLPIKITDENGQARVSTVVVALEQAYENNVKIIQISLSTNQFSQTLKDAIQLAHDRGILIVSTAGNTGVQEVRYPAAFPGVIGVGAINQSKQIEYYSTRGDHVSLVAPGSSIYTTTLNLGYSAVTGTSFSAPQVAGTAALVWSILPGLTNDDVKDILFQSADDRGENGKDPIYGYGVLNTEKAVAIAKSTKSTFEVQQTLDEGIGKTWITK